MFHILSRSGTGGENCFSDGFLAAKILHEENSELYDALTQTPLEFQYVVEGKWNLKGLGPTLVPHALTGNLEQVRFNPQLLTSLSHISTERMQQFYEAFIRFTEILDENQIWIQLEPGTALLIDNWRILHGRSGFTGERALAWSYFPRTDWLSKARLLGINC